MGISANSWSLLLLDNTHPIWYKNAGLRRNAAFGLGLSLVIATDVSFHFILNFRFLGLFTLAGMLAIVVVGILSIFRVLISSMLQTKEVF